MGKSMSRGKGKSPNNLDSESSGFSGLPYELREKIWLLTLPEQRVLHVMRSAKKSSIHNRSGLTVSSASYGLHHPQLLSANRESRFIGLAKLTKLFGVYWNLQIDYPYFEIKSNADDAVDLLAKARLAGSLDMFQNIAIDWQLWTWKWATSSMEFRCTFGNRFEGYEHPTTTLRNLPSIKRCAIVYIEHTLQKDTITPYEGWHLGPPTLESTSFVVGRMVPYTVWKESLEEALLDMEETIEKSGWRNVASGRCVLEVKAIHGRAKDYLPPSKMKRQTEGWEMDWFG